MDTGKRIVNIVAYIEMLIGVSTVIGLSASVVIGVQHKSANVFAFVIATAWISFFLGLGLGYYKEWARTLLVFFSGYIIITKILMFAGLLRFNGEIITFVPADLKNIMSIFYHTALIFYLTRTSVKKTFEGNHGKRKE